jgi:hypothetical protein
MAKAKKLEKLTQEERNLLRQAQEVSDIIRMPGWLTITKFIQDSLSFPDPKLYHSREEVIIPYSEAYGKESLAKEIRAFVVSQESIIKSLTEKIDEEFDKPDFAIGS